jgi:hypothetical protein
MKRVLCTVAFLLIATAVFAGDLTPQQAMEKTMNCPVCSVWGKDPAVSSNIRYDITPTKNGFIETFLIADEKLMPQAEKLEAECEQRAAGIPTMSAADKAKLCPFCVAHMTIDRKDITFNDAKTHLGWVRVASSSTPDGTKALTDYAAACQKQSSLMEQAAMEMQKQGVQKAKM